MFPLALLALAACDKGEDETPPVLSVYATQGTITAEDLSLAVPGIVGPPNLDDDDSDGTPDWNQGLQEGDNDFTTFQLEIPARTELSLVGGDLDKVRVYQNKGLILSDQVTSAEVGKGMSGDEFQVEFGDWRATATLQLKSLASGESFEVQLTGAPLMLNHHMQPSLLTTMANVRYNGYNNSAMDAVYAEYLGDAYAPVDGMDYDGDVWIQDELEFANGVGTDGYMGVVMDLIRDGQGALGGSFGLAPVAVDHFEGPNMMRGVWGDERATSQDYGGNIEVAPPTPDYPLGRIYYGAQGPYAPADDVQDLFDDQAVQAPFKLDSSWLCVGHVDEWFTTIPVEGSRLGWKLVYSDDQMAWDALASMDQSTRLTRFASDKGYATPADILTDSHLRDLNNELTEDVLEPQLQILIDELGLQEDDIIRIPGLFETVSGCGGGVAALFPGMANLIVADDTSGKTTLFVPDPMMRTNISSTDGDPIVASFESVMPPELGVAWVDDWQVYHMGLGEVHCGSNVVRAPYDGADWWNEGWALMESN